MKRTLIRNADIIATMEASGREIAGGCILIRDGVIEMIGPCSEIAQWPKVDETIDASGCVVTPGLVNTHHHLYQTLTRAVPDSASALLFGWLQSLYPIWRRMRPDDFVLAAQLGLSELALSGCTLSADHQYIFPNGARLDDTIHAAKEVGVRFHATRGSMSIGKSKGGLPPDSLIVTEDDILADSADLIDRFHDPRPGAMTRVALAPCSPFSVSRDLMRMSAILARDKGVMLHTHLSENDEDVAFSLERFGCRPGQYAEELGWVGPDVWHAHCVKLDDHEIILFAQTQTGVAHCPCSNCRLGSGIAPIALMSKAGVRVGLGVDGSASNDSAHLLSEARQAMLLQRVSLGADAFTPRQALALATKGGARTLGWSECGILAPDMRADIAIWDLNTLPNAGAWDPVAALVLCAPHRVRDLLVEGRRVVKDGEMVSIDVRALQEKARAAVLRLMS